MQADWTKVLGWPGYRVYDYQIDEARRHLTLRVRRKRGNRKLTCAQCGGAGCTTSARSTSARCGTFRALSFRRPYSKRFEDAVGEACEGAAARQVARRMRLAESTVRVIDLRYLERWEARRRKPPLRHLGVDEIYKGKREKFLTWCAIWRPPSRSGSAANASARRSTNSSAAAYAAGNGNASRRLAWICGSPSG